MNKNIIIREFVPQDSKAIIALMQQQDERLHGRDGRLRLPRTAAQIEEFVTEKVSAQSLLAVDAQRAGRGLAIHGVWEVAEDDEMRGFFLPRNGTVGLTLPHPDEPEAAAVTHVLLDAVEAWWQAQRVDGTLITWPGTTSQVFTFTMC